MEKIQYNKQIKEPKVVLFDRYPTKIRFIIFLILLFEAIGVFAYHNIEGWPYLDALYFTTATLTTVGYGDLTPKTELGRMFTIVYMVAGVGTVVYGLSTVAAHFIELREKEFIEGLSGMTTKKPISGIVGTIRGIYRNDKNKKTESHRSK